MPLPPAVAVTSAPPPSASGNKLLTPEEKAKVIAELEALAKAQGAGLAKARNSADCSKEKLKPADRLASANGDGEC